MNRRVRLVCGFVLRSLLWTVFEIVAMSAVIGLIGLVLYEMGYLVIRWH